MKTPYSLTLAATLIVSVAAGAQNYQTTLTGTIVDASGASIPDVLVTVVNQATNATRVTRTTGAGVYSVGNLPVGRYRLSTSSPGFDNSVTSEIELTVGQVRQIDLTLAVGNVSQEVLVEETQPALQTQTAEIGAVIGNQQIKDLPLNGRNIASLLALVPGAIDTGGGNVGTIRFAGRGVDDTNFRLDGVDTTGIRTQNQTAVLRLAPSTESISQLKVATLLNGADTGGTTGAQIDLVSKSGTNELHGGVFDFLRNNYFDDRGPFDLVTPPLKLNDFGVSLGGPIRKDKTFFFGVYEGLRQTVAATLIGAVPTEAYRASVLATSPALAPYINAYPHGNDTVLDANRINYRSSVASRQSEDSYLFRVQHIFGQKDTAFARYNLDRANINLPTGALRDRSLTETKPMNATVQYVHVFTPTLVNEAILGFNRVSAVRSTLGSVTVDQGLQYGLVVPGFAALANTRIFLSVPSTYSLLDNVTKTVGRHSIKAGMELKEIHFNYSQAPARQLTYNSAANFQANALDLVSYATGVPMHGLHKLETFVYVQDSFKLAPNFTLTYGLRYAFLNVLHEVHGRSLAWDDVTCGGFCPAGGLFTYPVYTDFEPRLSFGWQPSLFHDRATLRGGVGVYHGEGQVGDLNAPNDNTGQTYTLNRQNTPGLTYPADAAIIAATQQAGVLQPRGLARDRRDPRVTQYGLQFQAALPFNLVLDTGYIGSYADHQFTRTYHNNYIYGTTMRPLPNFGQIDYKDAISYGNFNGWQTSVQRQSRTGLHLQFNYLWSHSLNNGSSGGGDSVYPNNVSCLSCEYASSAQDARHVISADALYPLPFGRGQRFLNHGFAGSLLGGLSLTTIYTYRSGLPINVTLARAPSEILDGNNTLDNGSSQRPDLVPGVSLTPPRGRSSLPGGQWINPAAFVAPAKGTWGNAPRNLVNGPALWQADLGTAKRFPVFTDHIMGEFRAEIFNIFNRSQYANPDADFSAIGTPQVDLRTQTDPAKIAMDQATIAKASTTFSQTTAVVNTGATGSGTPRRIQFGLRFDF